jgi:lysophospholipase L1-like esterase
MYQALLFCLLTLVAARGALAADQHPPVVATAALEAPDQPTVKLDKEGKPDGGFQWKTNEFIKRGKAGPIGLLFVGDSITAGWDKVPKLWEAEFARWNPANFGIGGDRTQHVLWRIDQGMLDGYPPNVLVLMIGTNNLGWKREATEILKGQRAILDQIHRHLPKTTVLIMGLLPRGLEPATEGTRQMRAAIAVINAQLATWDDGKQTRFLDIGAAFLDPAGNPNPDLLPDGVHPNAKGYQIWAEALRPVLADLMQASTPAP